MSFVLRAGPGGMIDAAFVKQRRENALMDESIATELQLAI
jgi:hypothetical protein